MNFGMTEEIFGFDNLDIEREPQPSIREIVLPDGPPASADTSLADAEFIKSVSGSDDIVDDCGFPVLMQKGVPPLTLAQRAVQAISKSVNAVFPRVEFINANAVSRKARIAEIIDNAKAGLISKGLAVDGDGWSVLAQHCDEFIVSSLMEV
jgi:hypothetical protein